MLDRQTRYDKDGCPWKLLFVDSQVTYVNQKLTWIVQFEHLKI